MTDADQGLTRFDVNADGAHAVHRWPFLGINSAVSWRATYWTESCDGGAVPNVRSAGRRERRAAVLRLLGRATGPVFNRIFDPPKEGKAKKFKHVIEPTFTMQRVTAIDNFDGSSRSTATTASAGRR